MLSTIEVLGSSSKGNAYVLAFDDGTKIQLDAGCKNKNCKDVERVYLSHHHIDHDKFLKDFDSSKIIEPDTKDRVNNDWFSFNYTHHNLDGKPLPTNGYLILKDGEVILYLTDCGDKNVIGKTFPKTSVLIIECNWDYFGIKSGRIKAQDYGQRAFAKGGHLSNFDCLKLIDEMKIPKDCKILFVHKSEHHSDKDTFKLFECLPNKQIIAEKGQKIYAKSWKAI